MRFVTRAGVAVAGVVVTVTLAGCGSSSGTLLSTDAASALTADLSQASRALSAGDCLDAASALTDFKSTVGQLNDVNSTLVEMLNQGATTISKLAEERCPTGPSTNTRTRTTTTPTPSTTTTVATTTDTVATTTTAPVTTATTPNSGGGGLTTTSTPDTTSVPVTTPTTTSTPSSGGSGFGGTGNTGAGANVGGSDGENGGQ